MVFTSSESVINMSEKEWKFKHIIGLEEIDKTLTHLLNKIRKESVADAKFESLGERKCVFYQI